MRGGIDRLSDKTVKAFISRARTGAKGKGMLSDGAGLYLTLLPSGAAAWRLKYRFAGKEKLLAIGVYPEITLQLARIERDAARAHLRDGRDPMVERKLSRASAAVATDNTFAAVAGDWLTRRKSEWSGIHYTTSKRALERDVLPALGHLPVDSISTAMIARCLEKIMRRGSDETAERIWQHVHAVFDLAKTYPETTIVTNPAEAAAAVLQKRKAHVPRPALLEWAPLGDLLRRAQREHLSPAVYQAHRLVSFTAQRIANIVQARWEQFDLDSDSPTWTIPRATMKVTRGRQHDHKVILGPTITAELKAWRDLTGRTGYVFPGATGGDYLTRESLEKAYRKTLALDGKHSVHGWRSSFATLAKEAKFASDSVELFLDHVGDKRIIRDYDRGERLEDRRALAYWWDAQLVAAQRGTDPTVVPMRPRRTARA